MQIVPATRTPLTREGAAEGLLKAWPELDREAAASLLALIWIETGAGAHAVQHNPGNITPKQPYGGDAWRPPWFEVGPDSEPRLLKLHELMLQGKAPDAFKAYPNWHEGFVDFRMFLDRDSYKPLLEAASSGDMARFRAAIAQRYSADYTAAHENSLRSVRPQFVPLVSMQPAPKQSFFSGETGNLGLVLLLLKMKGLG